MPKAKAVKPYLALIIWEDAYDRRGYYEAQEMADDYFEYRVASVGWICRADAKCVMFSNWRNLHPRIQEFRNYETVPRGMVKSIQRIVLPSSKPKKKRRR